MFSKEWFFDLDKQLRGAGLDADSKSFDEIKNDLQNKRILSPDQFALAAGYVILAGGFSQKTAKRKHAEIEKYIKKAGILANQDDLLKLFNNRNKTAAILKIWHNRKNFRDGYYKQSNVDNKILYLSTLPHIGRITANHLARNLGENVVKYDIWIQRLGCVFASRNPVAGICAGSVNLADKIDNGALHADVRAACDEMFAHLERQTGLPRGYIDVVLWKACQNRFIKF
jgi:hypothetical protein